MRPGRTADRIGSSANFQKKFDFRKLPDTLKASGSVKPDVGRATCFPVVAPTFIQAGFRQGEVMNDYIGVLKKYAVFEGRARRKEYWMFILFNIIVAIVLNIVDGIVGSSGVLGGLYSLAVLVPAIAVAARRLHDTGRSGWWQLIALVPVIGFLVLLVFYVQDSQPGSNQYGANPKSGKSTVLASESAM